MVIEPFFVCFWFFEIQPQNGPFLTILPYYSLCKMAIFATFQIRVNLPFFLSNVFAKLTFRNGQIFAINWLENPVD